MNALLQETETLLSRLTRPEKALLLQWVVADIGDAFPGIDCRTEVCGGEPCIVRTRIPVWTLVQLRKNGLSEVDILQAYPTLNAEDLVEAWSYYRSHRAEIEQQILHNEEA